MSDPLLEVGYPRVHPGVIPTGAIRLERHYPDHQVVLKQGSTGVIAAVQLRQVPSAHHGLVYVQIVDALTGGKWHQRDFRAVELVRLVDAVFGAPTHGGGCRVGDVFVSVVIIKEL